MSDEIVTNEIEEISSNKLRSLIERIEVLEEEKQNVSADIREVFKEAKSSGFDVKIMKEILKLRKMDSDDLSEHDNLIELYKKALNME